jgi:hypothetical protein
MAADVAHMLAATLIPTAAASAAPVGQSSCWSSRGSPGAAAVGANAAPVTFAATMALPSQNFDLWSNKTHA